MKRVIDGVSYNTATATVAARWEFEDENGYENEATLYQTRGGAFFVVYVWEVPSRQWGEEPTKKTSFEALSREEVDRIVTKTQNLEIIDEKVLEGPPEATAEAAPAATIYVRVPASLKDRSEGAAKAEGLSINAYMTLCAERCNERPKVAAALGSILSTALAFEDGTARPHNMVRDMFAHIRDEVKKVARLQGWRDKEMSELVKENSYNLWNLI
jgi:hypothetical protein